MKEEVNVKAKIGELLLILGTSIFAGGAVGYITGHLSAEQISGIGALALIFICVGVDIKRRIQADKIGNKGEKDEKKEGIIAILAAFFVLFSAMIDPRVSAVIAIGILACIGIWKISNK